MPKYFIASKHLVEIYNLPGWFVYLPVVYLALVLVSTGHLLEHILAMMQEYVWYLPPWGLIGQVADREWLHVVYNLPPYLALLFAYVIIRKRISEAHRIDRGLSWLAAFFWIQGYHLIEHVVKMYQYLTTGIEPALGILGNWINLVPLHFTLVFITYILMVIVLFKSPLFGYPDVFKSESLPPQRLSG